MVVVIIIRVVMVMIIIMVVIMVVFTTVMIVITAIIYVIVRMTVAVLEFVDSKELVIVLIANVEENRLFLFTIVSQVIISIKFLLVHCIIVSKQELIEDLTSFSFTLTRIVISPASTSTAWITCWS